MNVADTLTLKRIYLNEEVGSNKRVLQFIAEHAAPYMETESRRILDALVARERLGSTAMGAGVAIPHARCDTIAKICSVFVRLDRPVDAAAPDHKPVDLFFALLVPENAQAEHSKLLSRISRVMGDEMNREMLRRTDSREEILAILTSEDRSAAA